MNQSSTYLEERDQNWRIWAGLELTSATSKETQAGDEFEGAIRDCSTDYGDGFDDYGLDSSGEIVREEEEDEDWGWYSEDSFEIKKEKGRLDTIREDCESSVFSIDIRKWEREREEVVYVGVGAGDHRSSLEAVSWTLKHWITPSSTLCLLHVFPLVRFIPSPMGKLPRSHVNVSYVRLQIEQEKAKRKLRLRSFIDLCLASQVKVETVLIEGDNVAKSLVDHVHSVGITKLVIGTTKTNPSKRGRRRRNALADQIVKNVPEKCDVKIICEGKDVIYDIIESPYSRSSDSSSPRSSQEEDESRRFVPFKKLFAPRFSSPR